MYMPRNIVYRELVFPDIFLNAVTDEQKAIRVHDFNRRISKNIKEVCESLGIQCVTPSMPAILSFQLWHITAL